LKKYQENVEFYKTEKVQESFIDHPFVTTNTKCCWICLEKSSCSAPIRVLYVVQFVKTRHWSW